MATRAAATSNEELLTAIKNLESRMNERITSMKRDLTQEREQADERLVKRMKMEKAPTFKRKSHEVQYTFNEEIKAKFDSVKAALHETPPAVEKAKSAIEEGQFGKVYKASLVRARSENMTVAVKTIKKYKSEQETSDFLHEMGVMMDLMHPNIIHLYGIVQQESPWLVLQYLPNGDLKNYLIRNERSVDQLIKYMIDVAMGMHYIMERGLVHRDLAARNVMVDDRETCKVADFGLLREIPKDNTIYQATTELPWPIRWMAPESLDNREFSPATDVWSFGVLLWEMYYPNQLPYAELSNVQVPTRIMTGHRLSIPLAYPSIVESIMKACWQKKPGKRPSFLLISTLLTNMTVQVQA